MHRLVQTVSQHKSLCVWWWCQQIFSHRAPPTLKPALVLCSHAFLTTTPAPHTEIHIQWTYEKGKELQKIPDGVTIKSDQPHQTLSSELQLEKSAQIQTELELTELPNPYNKHFCFHFLTLYSSPYIAIFLFYPAFLGGRVTAAYTPKPA